MRYTMLTSRVVFLDGLPILRSMVDGLTPQEFSGYSDSLMDLYNGGKVVGCFVILVSQDVEGSALVYAQRVMKNYVSVPTVIVGAGPRLTAMFNVVRVVLPWVFTNIKLAEVDQAESLLLEMLSEAVA
jgi:hypothetical protein